jgi:hypothetical protein
LEPKDAWFIMYGDHPQILAAVEMGNLGSLQNVLESSDWADLTKQLLDYVEDFQFKVIPARTGFQL